MAKTIGEVADEIRADLSPLPEGYSVTIDNSSQCILIANHDLGFAITPQSVLDHDQEGWARNHARLMFGELIDQTKKLHEGK